MRRTQWSGLHLLCSCLQLGFIRAHEQDDPDHESDTGNDKPDAERPRYLQHRSPKDISTETYYGRRGYP
jgi:hypothetical protein